MRRQLAVLTAGVILGVASMVAQQSSTVILKSGERLNGELIDLARAGFAFRVDGGDERTIPRADVLAIEFGTGDVARPSELNDLQDGQQLALLRNGDVVVGEFYDIGGRSPLRLTFKTSAGERELSSADVRRIYFSKATDDKLAAAPPAGGTTHSFSVSSNIPWTSTNLTVRQGQTVWFDASGQVETANGAIGGPSGNNRSDRGSPIPSAQMGALLGRIVQPGRSVSARGTTAGAQPFVIGDQRSVEMPADGVLYLGVNDSGLKDNKGSFQVRITVE